MFSTNEVLYRIQQALHLTLDQILEAYHLEEYAMQTTHLTHLLVKRQDKNFVPCSYEELGVFLDGLIHLKRGQPSQTPAQDVALTNNLILKKLRIALELKEAEIEIIFSLADQNLSKQQLSSLFRKESHKNFKTCSDALLLAFLDGLDEFYFVDERD